jgi:D-serine dehydratase
LFVYLPCGIGGAPGGIAFGLKVLFGDAVHCFFAEPVEAPCMALGLISGKHDEASVYDIGLGVKTDADGLAVSRPSGFVGKFIMPLISGALTVEDSTMYKYVWLAHETEGLKLEPSATAGFAGPDFVLNSDSGKNYLDKYGIDPSKATHILWTTGGRYVPEEEYNKFLEKGKAFN